MLMNDWDNRSTMGIPLLSRALVQIATNEHLKIRPHRRLLMKLTTTVITILLSVAMLSAGTAETIFAQTSAQDRSSESADSTADNARTVLKTHCQKCHGAEAREGGLRLTSKEDLLFRNDSGEPAIVSGNSASSELIRRITATGDQRMPPEGEPLSESDISTLKHWIDAGADWSDEELQSEKHWAYIAAVRPEINDSQVHPIDFLVRRKLADDPSGLQPCAEESPARLLRRVSLDLIGLPPSPSEVIEFEADPSQEHYEKIVDRLLASPRFGEKWARQWLDLARYADSNGYQADQFRSVWAYRDWVINALNADQPFDQFTVEQLAGDLLPDATIDQKIATGFHRLTTCNVEAGVDPEENRTNQVADRVTTTGTVWLGTTLECARCHNHKYDPFTQQDFYQLFAFFNNTPLEVDPPGDGGVQYEVAGPMLELPQAAHLTEQRTQLNHELASLKEQITERTQLLAKPDADWEKRVLTAAEASAVWHVLNVTQFSTESQADYKHLDDHSILLTGAAADKDTYNIAIETRLTDITAFKLETLTDETLPGTGPGRTDDKRPNFVLYEFDASIAPSNSSGIQNSMRIEFSNATADFSQAKWDASGLIDRNPATGWAIANQFGKPHEVTLQTTTPIGFPDGSRVSIRLPQYFGNGRLIGRLRISAMTGTASQTTLPSDLRAAILVPVKERSNPQKKIISQFRQNNDDDLQQLQARVKIINESLTQLTPSSTAVMTEMSQTRRTSIFKRGDFLSPGADVRPSTPAVLHGFASEGTVNRLDLARWLVSAENPLTARVTVNRWWAEFFGTGIVETVEDFGSQGSRPSHPDLLDWLAVEFMEHGWSTKHIHRLIVTSATYKQSSRISSEQWELDPFNKLLTRGPRLRLSAETIRDNALACCGLLSSKMGGPPVYPPQPDNIWRHVGRNAPKYETDQDEDRFRRGIYVVWRRSAPYPSFVNFDAPDRASCVVKRSRSNTPLQALTLLNDPAYVEMARFLAKRILIDKPNETFENRLEYAVRLCVARAPTPSEAATLAELWRQEHERFRENNMQTEKLIPTIERIDDVALAEQAAWFSVANVLLNLDETITRN